LVKVGMIDNDDYYDDSNNSSIEVKYKYAVLISDKTKISSLGPVNRTLHAVSFYTSRMCYEVIKCCLLVFFK